MIFKNPHVCLLPCLLFFIIIIILYFFFFFPQGSPMGLLNSHPAPAEEAGESDTA